MPIIPGGYSQDPLSDFRDRLRALTDEELSALNNVMLAFSVVNKLGMNPQLVFVGYDPDAIASEMLERLLLKE